MQECECCAHIHVEHAGDCLLLYTAGSTCILSDVMITSYLQSESQLQLPETDENDLIDPRTFKVLDEQV